MTSPVDTRAVVRKFLATFQGRTKAERVQISKTIVQIGEILLCYATSSEPGAEARRSYLEDKLVALVDAPQRPFDLQDLLTASLDPKSRAKKKRILDELDQHASPGGVKQLLATVPVDATTAEALVGVKQKLVLGTKIRKRTP
jgi:hypothetical protein